LHARVRRTPLFGVTWAQLITAIATRPLSLTPPSGCEQSVTATWWISVSDTCGVSVTRTLGRTTGAVVAALEMDQPQIVTIQRLRDIAADLGISTDARVLAARLRNSGWLLPTPIRGTYEFAPGSHAGPLGHADPLTPVRAALHSRPDLEAALALESAAWAHNLADRLPNKLEVAIPVGHTAPAGLERVARVLRFTAQLSTVSLRGVPVHAPETLLVHLAYRPSQVRSWTSVGEWLPDLVHAVDGDRVVAELEGRDAAVGARVGYLVSGLRPSLARRMERFIAGRVWFGPRGALRRHNARWQIADTVLPFDPVSLPPLGSEFAQ